MNRYIFILLTTTYLFSGGFDDEISIGDKVKIRHMAKTHKDGVVGDTLYVYKENKKIKIKDKEGALNINTIKTDGKTLRKNGRLNVTHIQENTRINRVSKHKTRLKYLKYKRDKNNGVSIGEIDIRGTKIKNVKIYDRNNHYRIK